MTIRKPTVLILGAGSSSHFGYPLGAKLLSEIVKLKTKVYLEELPEPYSKEDGERFITQLARSGYSSVDQFLEQRPVDSVLGKFLITLILKTFEKLNNLFPPWNSGWYQDLFNELIKDDNEIFAGNELAVVTFNYDRSLEAYLHTALQYRFNLTENQALQELERIPIIHVHGELGAYPDIPYEQVHDLRKIEKISGSIQVIHELSDSPGSFCSPRFEKAHNFINKAERVVFLGFGFHPDNLRRLKVDWSEFENRDVRASMFGIVRRQSIWHHLSLFLKDTFLPVLSPV